ncbi:MAG TPA: peptidoglycan editing factor PgeF [Thermodesulfobacteriota bacterium]
MPPVETVNDLVVLRPHLGPAEAAFTARAGGVSPPPYASLNLGAGSGDDPARVAANGRRLAAALGFAYERVARLRQVHGAEVAVVDGTEPASGPIGEYDAAVTDRPGVVLLVLAADCVPVLLVDPARPAVGAVHAGWRGVVADAPGAAVRALARAYGSRPGALRAAIGPCIGPCCYEVDAPVAERFAEAGLPFAPPVATPSAAREGRPRWRLDLVAAVRRRLEAAGLLPDGIEAAGLCTACRGDLFFSHRRDGARTGRQAGVIWLPEATER